MPSTDVTTGASPALTKADSVSTGLPSTAASNRWILRYVAAIGPIRGDQGGRVVRPGGVVGHLRRAAHQDPGSRDGERPRRRGPCGAGDRAGGGAEPVVRAAELEVLGQRHQPGPAAAASSAIAVARAMFASTIIGGVQLDESDPQLHAPIVRVTRRPLRRWAIGWKLAATRTASQDAAVPGP